MASSVPFGMAVAGSFRSPDIKNGLTADFHGYRRGLGPSLGKAIGISKLPGRN